MTRYPWVRLDVIESFVPLMKRQGVSVVARSDRGFLPAYRRARGRSAAMSTEWQRKRDGFIARHMAQVNKRGESLWTRRGHPTRRHLALIAWAYTPDPDGVLDWYQQHRARRNSTVVWKPEWVHDPESWQRGERWTLLDLPLGILRVTRNSLGPPYRGARNQAFLYFIGPDYLAHEFLGTIAATSDRFIAQGEKLGRSHYSLTIFKGNSNFGEAAELFSSPEEAKQAGLDLYLLTAARVPGLPAALPPAAQVRMDQLLSRA